MNASSSSYDHWFYVLLFLAAYFLPLIVAIGRKHNSSGVIAFVNILLGWSIIGWLVALIWSMNSNTKIHDLRRAEMHADAARPVIGIAPAPSASLSDELRKITEMRDAGALTPAEFERAKAKLIGS